MRFISADYLYTLDSKPIKNGVLQINNFGEIINIFKNEAVLALHHKYNFKDRGTIIKSRS